MWKHKRFGVYPDYGNSKSILYTTCMRCPPRESMCSPHPAATQTATGTVTHQPCPFPHHLHRWRWSCHIMGAWSQAASPYASWWGGNLLPWAVCPPSACHSRRCKDGSCGNWSYVADISDKAALKRSPHLFYNRSYGISCVLSCDGTPDFKRF